MSLYTCTLATGLLSCPTQRCGPNVQPSTEVSDALPARAAGKGQENSNYLWRFSGPRWPLVFNHVEMNDEELAPERSFTGPRSGQMASHHVGTSPK
jgi:hypothetical protein